MRRLSVALVLMLLGMPLAAWGATMDPSQQRAVPVNSSTAVFVKSAALSSGDTADGSGTFSTTQISLSASDANVKDLADDVLNGLPITLSGCADSDAHGMYIITDFATSNDQVTFTPTASATTDNTCEYEIGGGLPSGLRELTLGGCAGTCYYSFRSGGTSGTDRFRLLGGQFRTIQQPRGLNYVEVLSVSATDTIYVEYH